ncbi:ATP-binding protein, partial [Elizabethkingia miricola]|uniref:ATP-binding protein n=2 Tax=Elizabethkingia miricola TaxID=172045 RepID=UPI0014079F36|nr:ATP-binding protein [Elizabethkingia miricola]
DNIVEVENLPVDFFSPKINISAIIGKNGSGKSSIIDLFIASINQISLKLRAEGFLNTTAELESTNKEKKNESLIHCEMFYQIEDTFFQIIIDDDDFTFNNIKLEKESQFDLKQFFYSEIISYSVYAFNSWEIGDWIDYLFHKNDSYQIPVVINPKRESKQEGRAGIININTESYLLQQRLLS